MPPTRHLAELPGGRAGRLAVAVAAMLVLAAAAGCGGDTAEPGPSGSASSTSVPPSSSLPATSATAGTPSEPGPTATASATPGGASPTASPTAAAYEWPPFESVVESVTVEQLGAAWEPGCPVPPEDLRLLVMTHATPEGVAATGRLIVSADAVDDVLAAFEEIYAARFPITRMVDEFGGDDDVSMAADNTSGFNCRTVTGGTGYSRHSYGNAIDINPLRNPYVRDDIVQPPAGANYLDRTDVRAGMIVAGDVVVTAFTSRGFEWGGDFETLKDYQHFAR